MTSEWVAGSARRTCRVESDLDYCVIDAARRLGQLACGLQALEAEPAAEMHAVSVTIHLLLYSQAPQVGCWDKLV
jgi:hypothetical protein